MRPTTSGIALRAPVVGRSGGPLGLSSSGVNIMMIKIMMIININIIIFIVIIIVITACVSHLLDLADQLVL
jgi:hypothetical protein